MAFDVGEAIQNGIVLFRLRHLGTTVAVVVITRTAQMIIFSSGYHIEAIEEFKAIAMSDVGARSVQSIGLERRR